MPDDTTNTNTNTNTNTATTATATAADTASMMDTNNVTNNVEDQNQEHTPALTIAQAPSFCRLCNVELRGVQTWRAHVKSDGHVDNLRQKVAEPGSAASPPSPLSDVRKGKGKRTSVEIQDDLEDDSEEEDEEYEEPSAPAFVPGHCLFCPYDAGELLEDSMAHMASAHGFTVPFQDYLAVDIETVVGYLHFVIHAYRECISCGGRRATVEGIRQHMAAKGHCRFDVTPDTEEFYQMPQTENNVLEQAQSRPDASVPLRLPSGKIILHRKDTEAQEPRIPRVIKPDRERGRLEYAPPGGIDSNTGSFSKTNTSSSSTSGATSDSLELERRGTRGEGGQVVRSSEAILAAQLTKLRIAGDRAQVKMEQRKRSRLEAAGNLTFTKHFKVDAGDSRAGRQFCC